MCENGVPRGVGCHFSPSGSNAKNKNNSPMLIPILFHEVIISVGVKYNWSSTQILQVLVIKCKYKYFAFSPIKYSSTSSTDTPSTSTSTSVNIGWLICTGNTRAVFPGNYRPENIALSNDNPCPIPPKWEIPGNTKKHVHM